MRVRQQVDTLHILKRVSMDFQGRSQRAQKAIPTGILCVSTLTEYVEGVPLKATELDAKAVAYTLVTTTI